MSRRATRELIEAAAALEPADRALVNLWIHRGLDDDRLAALTGMSAVAVQARRERILAGLGEQLGQSPDEVLAALRSDDTDETDDPDETTGAVTGDGTGDYDPGAARPDVTATDGGLDSPATVSTAGLPNDGFGPESQPEPEPSHAEPQAEPDAEAAAPRPSGGATTSTSHHRSRIWAAFTAAVAIVVAVVLVVLLAGGGSSDPSTQPAADPTTSAPPPPATTAGPPGTTPTVTSTTTPARTATTPGNPSFAGLPGPNELTHVSGVVQLIGKVGDLKLKLTVKGLPLVHHAHYEAWLFNSVVDSRALGHVTRDEANLYRLPPGARRFHFIDVSVQTKGTTAHSGVSEVRAVNPVDGPRDIVHRARARRPHRLHRAHGAAHHAAPTHHRKRRAGASGHSTRGARHHDGRRHSARHHRRGKRSKKAKTS